MVKVQDPDKKAPLTGDEKAMNSARQVSMKKFEDQYAEPPPYTSRPPSAKTSTSNRNGTNGASLSVPTADQLNFESSPLEIPTPAECIAHLKLLHAFAKLRRDIGNRDGLFGISLEKTRAHEQSDDENGAQSSTDGESQPGRVQKENAGRVAVDTHASAPDAALAERIRDKRWAVFVHQAVDRFEAWWNSLSTKSSVWYSPIRQSDFEASEWNWQDGKAPITRFTTQGDGYASDEELLLPPLDVLMVWHTFMLNPRTYLEDCIRYSKHRLWRTMFPWELIHGAIDNDTLKYNPTPNQNFLRDAGHAWEPPALTAPKKISCPKCLGEHEVPWTQPPVNSRVEALEAYLTSDTGYAGPAFSHPSSFCELIITHEKLRVGKFCDDTDGLIDLQRPLAGTILNMWGEPTGTAKGKKLSTHEAFFIHRIIERKPEFRAPALREQMEHITVNEITRKFANLMRSNYDVMLVNSNQMKPSIIYKGSRMAIRKVLSHYWDNSSIFGIDLVGAVLRQGSFVQKMVKLDWLHSPSVMATTQRLIVKYHRFVRLAGENPKKTVVPTLDVDLAWLSPKLYYRYTLAETAKFLNHDDKIPESNLHTSFQWTAQAYEKKYGQPYSECSCWYCECTREPLRSNFLSKISLRRASLSHPRTGRLTSPPGPHISAHNALPLSDERTAAQRRKELEDLDLTYAKVVKRYQKQKAAEPPKRDADKDAYMYSAYGYPMMYPMPVYVPYYADPGLCEHTQQPGGGGCAPGTCCPDASLGGCAGGAGTPGCSASCGGHGDAGGGCGTCGSGGDGGGDGGGGDGGGCGGCGG
ncbi:hypothetical protein EK21DRAFT_99049 [Setomelanomma holmii]|uniref:Uncharacterized protein n=1 Tax=Setomelanomma holmii TaxID=210430 RepID=A0A9P4LR41_9PLEO|nr:hypothetical protein EK21DRAFT_99049 [Setomelanomma holmii]